ncbi:hypothetical protein DPMN_180458 [Dreissena polymorpha]|uniref:Uncharacterized protein n=1 Tax=Dreissena polymorpha TaxID=45954 RepID=A0A9D4EGY1_DREPO|nr:hypothetical protein DPMN_180458 [Dreissena polymorpha]
MTTIKSPSMVVKSRIFYWKERHECIQVSCEQYDFLTLPYKPEMATPALYKSIIWNPTIFLSWYYFFWHFLSWYYFFWYYFSWYYFSWYSIFWYYFFWYYFFWTMGSFLDRTRQCTS